MKNELQNLTEDISRLYEEITQKTESLGQIDSITRLYDELQTQLLGISTEEVDLRSLAPAVLSEPYVLTAHAAGTTTYSAHEPS